MGNSGDLPRGSIDVVIRRGNSPIATVVEVLERRADFVLVRDSGKG